MKKKEKSENVEKIAPKSSVNKRLILFSGLCLLAAVILYQLRCGSCDFWTAYNKNFNKIVYGDENYCLKKINTSHISEKLREQMINQDDAIRLIEGSLKLANQEGYVQIVLQGSTGVGKSLTSELLASNFLWKRNVQKIIYDSQQPDLLQAALNGLSKCGFNLIIIDDLDISNETVEIVRQFETELQQHVKREELRVVLVNIFKGTLSEESISNLANFVIIDYRSFTQDDLIDCIELHQRLYNIPISESEMDELKELNYTASGCKQVSKRLVSQSYK
jgi:hypothetical protein